MASSRAVARWIHRRSSCSGRRRLVTLGAALLSEFALLPAAEFGLLLADPIYWGVGGPRGDRHSVLVLPGLFAGDGYLEPLHRWLLRVGYTPVRSGLKRNPGWSDCRGRHRRPGRD